MRQGNRVFECETIVCYTLPMFIHRTSTTGLAGRGAWPWRKPLFVRF